MSDLEVIESDPEEETLESRDVESLRVLLEAETKAKKGATDECGGTNSTSVQVVDRLQLCLSSNHELQRLLCNYLKEVDAAIEENKRKREDLRRNGLSHLKNLCTLRNVRRRKKSYFTDHAGNYPDIPSAFYPPGQMENYYFHDSQWSSSEDFTLRKHVTAQAIELAGHPYKMQLESTTDDEEIKIIRQKMKELSNLKDDSSLLTSLDTDQIFWDNIAYEGFRSRRTACDCRQRWINKLSPSINTSPWTKEEDTMLMRAGKKTGGRQWSVVAEAVGNGRSAFSCFKRYQNTFRNYNRRSSWPKVLDDELKNAVTKYGEDNWLLVARSLSRSVSVCRSRWLRTVSPRIKKGRWDCEEDKRLTDAVQQWGTSTQYNWKDISDSVPTRSSAQCRERWVNILDPNLKCNDFNKAEDVELMKVCQKYQAEGIPIPWSKVACSLPGRTDARCASRWRQLSSSQKIENNYKQIKIWEKMKQAKGKKNKSRSTLDFHEFDANMLPEELCVEAEAYGKEAGIKKSRKALELSEEGGIFRKEIVIIRGSSEELSDEDDTCRLTKGSSEDKQEQQPQLRQVSMDAITPALDIGDLLNRQELIKLGAIPISVIPDTAATTSPCSVAPTSANTTPSLQYTSNSSISSLLDRHFGASLPVARSKPDPPPRPPPPTPQTSGPIQVDFSKDNPFPTGPRMITAFVNAKMIVSGNDPRPKFVVTSKLPAKKPSRKRHSGSSGKEGRRLNQASEESTSAGVDQSTVTQVSSSTTLPLITQATLTNAATHPMMATAETSTAETSTAQVSGIRQDAHSMPVSSVTRPIESALVTPVTQFTNDILTASTDQPSIHVAFEDDLHEENAGSITNPTAQINSEEDLSDISQNDDDSPAMTRSSMLSHPISIAVDALIDLNRSPNRSSFSCLPPSPLLKRIVSSSPLMTPSPHEPPSSCTQKQHRSRQIPVASPQMSSRIFSTSPLALSTSSSSCLPQTSCNPLPLTNTHQNLSITPECFKDACSHESAKNAHSSKEITSGSSSVNILEDDESSLNSLLSCPLTLSGKFHPSTSPDQASNDDISPEVRVRIDDNKSQDIIEDCILSDGDVGLSSNATGSGTRGNGGTNSMPDSTRPRVRVIQISKAVGFLPLILSRDCLNQNNDISLDALLRQRADPPQFSRGLEPNENVIDSETVANTSTDDYSPDCEVSDNVAKLQYRIWNGNSSGQFLWASKETVCDEPSICARELNPAYIPSKVIPRSSKRHLNAAGHSCSKRMRESHDSQESDLSNQEEGQKKETANSGLKEIEKRKRKHKPLLERAEGAEGHKSSMKKGKSPVSTKLDVGQEETRESGRGRGNVRQRKRFISGRRSTRSMTKMIATAVSNQGASVARANSKQHR